MGHEQQLASANAWPELIRRIRARTPARIFVDHGAAYSTSMQLELRNAHARAVDAVWAEFDLDRDFPPGFVAQWKLFQVSSRAECKSQFLLRPDLGRQLADEASQQILRGCLKTPDVQIVIGDGLSTAAVAKQAPALLPLLVQEMCARGWSVGRSFVVRHCRVGLMNQLGDLLSPRVLVLLIGERPGLATAESLSAYMAYAPQSGQTDADRNLISNIHARGVAITEAASRVTNLAAQMLAAGRSGTSLKEDWSHLLA